MQHFITTPPMCAPCPRCGRLELTGHAEGLSYRADPVPLTAHAELAARIAGRRTYALIAGQLAYRNPSRIAGDHRGRPPVFADHRCQQPPAPGHIDTAHLTATTRLITKASPTPDRPPPVDDIEFDALALFTRELGATAIDRTAEKAPF